MVTNIGSKYF